MIPTLEVGWIHVEKAEDKANAPTNTIAKKQTLMQDMSDKDTIDTTRLKDKRGRETY